MLNHCYVYALQAQLISQGGGTQQIWTQCGRKIPETKGQMTYQLISCLIPSMGMQDENFLVNAMKGPSASSSSKG